jgi:hypothetical protein
VAAASVLICVDEAGAGAAVDELAAIAAAAMASGAVALPGAAAAACTPVDATVAGIATATGFGVVTDGAPCGVELVGSATEILSKDCFSGDFVLPAFDTPDFVPSRWTASVPALALGLGLALLLAWEG